MNQKKYLHSCVHIHASDPRTQPNIQRRLLIEHINPLVRPITFEIGEFHVEMPYHFRQRQLHLSPSQTTASCQF